MKEHVLVYSNIKEIHIENAGQNVSLIAIVLKIKLALKINVLIFVPKRAGKMLYVLSLTTYQCVVVKKAIQETPLLYAFHIVVCLSN